MYQMGRFRPVAKVVQILKKIRMQERCALGEAPPGAAFGSSDFD